MKFTIAIEAGTKKAAFGVVVPDLPGCFSAGDTVEEAFDNVREAIEAFCEILAEEGKDIPATKTMTEWQTDSAYKGWTWGIVDVPIERFFGPAEKINITVPGRLLKQIDDYAKRYGQTRSGFMTQAALDAMRRPGEVHDSLAHVKRRTDVFQRPDFQTAPREPRTPRRTTGAK